VDEPEKPLQIRLCIAHLPGNPQDEEPMGSLGIMAIVNPDTLEPKAVLAAPCRTAPF
jgi:hypothetical protein